MTVYVYCPCGRCPARRMWAGEVPACVEEEGSPETVITLLVSDPTRFTGAFGTRDLTRTSRVQDGRPADPADEWREWLDNYASSLTVKASRLRELGFPTYEEDRRIQRCNAMSAVAAKSKSFWGDE